MKFTIEQQDDIRSEVIAEIESYIIDPDTTNFEFIYYSDNKDLVKFLKELEDNAQWR